MALRRSSLDWIANEVSHALSERSSFEGMDPCEPSNMRSFVAFEWTQAAPQSLRVNDVAPANM